MSELIKLSLKEDNFSSHIIHTKDEILKEDKRDEYTIPDRFDVNKIVLLAVNPSKFYIYWFLKEELKTQLKDKNLKIKLFVEKKEVMEVSVSNCDGEIYLYYHAPFKEVFCVLGYMENNQFIEVLKSNKFIAPSDIIHYEPEEKWYNKKENSSLIKESPLKEDSLLQLHKAEEVKELINLPTSY